MVTKILQDCPLDQLLLRFLKSMFIRFQAEKLKRFKGGVSIITVGSLSPEARNKQVKLYENGEVDYLVGTEMQLTGV